MKQGNGLPEYTRRPAWAAWLLLVLLASPLGWSQQSTTAASSDTASAIQELRQQINELRSAMTALQAETEQYRAENAALRRELHNSSGQVSTTGSEPQSDGSYDTRTASSTKIATDQLDSAARPRTSTSLEERVSSLEESSQFLNSKLNDQYQTKIESASKYRVRLSGTLLLNLFNTHGGTDNQDFPSYVRDPGTGTGAFGATVRQSEIGLEVFGPTLAGAKTSANLQADFAGGFPNTWNGVNSGIFRLRTASIRMDWEHTSVLVGQDNLFLSPLSPTSFASLSVPALNYSGNLWAWTPQVRLEHRFDIADGQTITLQGAILDNLTGEFPADPFFRMPSAGESSRQPAYGMRAAWTGDLRGQPLSFGAGGYYSRQAWGSSRYVDGWAAMTDWSVPLVPRISWTGELYRGRAIGGIGGGVSQSIVYDGDPAITDTPFHGLDDAGGWTQLKFKATSLLEFNAAVGVDNPYTSELRAAAPSEPHLFGPLLLQNRGGLVNFVFRPRSSLLFSGEYRHLRTRELNDISNGAQQFNLMMGILF